ncbi:hypothetical protein EJF36_03710 [Bacillus sp. HMF5848]|uniref:hypothetical protein n=1 Tax=Bacillus sp. HMF5848 TaxID=2495421 RepID=UPI000F790984|nr:hypothetical protein [Bacillus sp. HMF5848]RSK26052.1 hypothetical protein EJF36_03710 [Bacillus sp. HMF5848]
MWKKIIPGALALLVFVPAISLADNYVTNQATNGNEKAPAMFAQGNGYGRGMMGDDMGFGRGQGMMHEGFARGKGMMHEGFGRGMGQGDCKFGGPGMMRGERGGGMFASSDNVHKEMYLTLLVEKYDEDQADEWEAALEKRSELIEEIKAAFPTEEQEAAREEHQQAMQDLRDRYVAGDITKEELIAERDKFRDSIQGQFADLMDSEDIQNLRDERKTLYDALTEAVDAEDAAAIKVALTDLLEHCQAWNDVIEKALNDTVQ